MRNATLSIFLIFAALLTSNCTQAQTPETSTASPAAPVGVKSPAAPKPPAAPEPKTVNTVVVVDGVICVQSTTVSLLPITSEQISAKIEEIENQMKAATEKHEKEMAAARERVAELSKIVVQTQRQEKKQAKAKE